MICFDKNLDIYAEEIPVGPAEAELGSMGRRREAACTCSVRNMKNTILRRWDFIYRREKNLTVYGKDKHVESPLYWTLNVLLFYR